jgi:uncharacterized protein (TIGR03118 family)
VNLVSDQPGLAANVDPDLINPWGVARDDQNRAFWIADNDSGKLSIVDETGVPVAVGQNRNADGTFMKIDLGVGITGAAKNPSAATFLMHADTGCQAASMLFSNEGGQIIAVNTALDAAKGMIVADRSAAGASYKGLAIIDIAPVVTDQTQVQTHTYRILAPDFANARVDVFDENFQLVNPATPADPSVPASAMFQDAQVPAGYAPFNVVALGAKLYITYAQQNADKTDSQNGAGLGMVDEFDLQGNFIRTIAPTGQLLNGPWGVALAPGDFCKSTANALLIGNFGDGHITAIDVESGRLLGQLANDKGDVLVIDGLWSMTFDANHMYFTAGPGDEAHGLFGYLMSNE